MAQAENVGYDATGRKSFKVVSADVNGDTKVEIHRCDLLDLRVTYENRPDPDTGELRWMEKHSAVVSNSGLIAEYRRFQQNPASFFV